MLRQSGDAETAAVGTAAARRALVAAFESWFAVEGAFLAEVRLWYMDEAHAA